MTYPFRDADFVLGADVGDEELPRPRDLDPEWVQRTRRPAAALLALLVVGVVALRAHDTDTRPTAAPSPIASPGELRDTSRPITRVTSGLVSDDQADVCPSGAVCRTSSTLPAGVAVALTRTFPGYTTPSARTVTVDTAAGPRLVGRFVHVVTATADVTVQVLSQRLPASTVVTGSGGGALAVVQRQAAGLTVRVTVGGPAATGPAPLRLAVDARLPAA